VEILEERARGLSVMQPSMFQPGVRLALDVIVAELLETDDIDEAGERS
jgi:hypothetical protein